MAICRFLTCDALYSCSSGDRTAEGLNLLCRRQCVCTNITAYTVFVEKQRA